MAAIKRMFWFRFNPGDWLGSPHVQAMTASERGYYIQILSVMWNHNQGRSEWEGLPLEESRVMRLAGARPAAWRRFAAAFIGPGKPLQKSVNGYESERLTREFSDALKRSSAGHDAAGNRWKSLNGADDSASESHPNRIDSASRSHMQATVTSTDTEEVPPTEVSKPTVVDPDAVVGLWNGIMVPLGCSKVEKLTGGRRRKIRTRTTRRLDSLGKWENYFRKLAAIDWMTGSNDRGWYVPFDYAIRNDENVEKASEHEISTRRTQAQKFAAAAEALRNQ